MKRNTWIAILALVLALPAAAQSAYGPGRIDLPLVNTKNFEVGIVTIHNNNAGLLVDVQLIAGWTMAELDVHAGWAENPVPMANGNPVTSLFDHQYDYWRPATGERIYLDFAEDLDGFRWGEPCEPQRLRHIAVHARGGAFNAEHVWARGNIEFESAPGWWLTYLMAHKSLTHFIDSPVAGLRMVSPTEDVYTDASGAAPYFPGESGTFYVGGQRLGTTLLDHKVSPLDLFPQSDTDDPRVANMAMLLQSLDADGEPQKGIDITAPVRECFDSILRWVGPIEDWRKDEHVELLVDRTIARCAGMVPLVKVSREDAVENLERSLNSSMYRKNVSRTPELGSAKAKLNVMGVWFPARHANDELATVEYYDEDGELIADTAESKPLVATYADADPETGAHDTWAAISRDDGDSWKRKNLSRAAYRSSFDVDGAAYYGHAKKPVFHVKGNRILVAWTSKYCSGGRPRYAIEVCPDEDGDGVADPCIVCNGDGDEEVCEPDYVYDDAYRVDDIWGVAGPQLSHDYTEDGYPEVGEVPYSCVWTARGVVATQGDVNKGLGEFVGDIVWFKPERLTSGRRDAYQIFMGAATSAGFAIAWQEDPDGLRPGDAKGPGPGWGGATTNHKTDIWYSFVTWADFAKVDTHFEPGGDPEHDDPDLVGRPKALVPMTLPVRVSDNDVVNTENMWIELDVDGLPVLDEDGNVIPIPNPDTNSEDSDGSHRYGYLLDGLWDWNGTIYRDGEVVDWAPGDGGTLYEFTNEQGDLKRVVVTADGRALDGNTGAARPNLFLQAFTKPDGTKSAWAILAYEETKGLGSGPDEEGSHDESQDGSGYDPYDTVPDEGKNFIYHSFAFTTPDLVSAGTIMNLPETDENGDPLYVVEPEYLGSEVDENGELVPIPNPDAGEPIPDWKGDPILAYENARRPRFILQSKAGAFGGTKPDGTFKKPDNSGTVLIALYKEGQEGHGRPSDIMARRCVVKDADGNIKSGNPYTPANFRSGAQNVSSMSAVETWINPDADPDARGDGVKVCRWEQSPTNLADKSGENPYEDARAHRGQIRGDFVIMGYSYTPNWAASRNAHDKYDFYVRRSFDGGAQWTTDPAADTDVVHTDIFIDPDGMSGAEFDEEGNDVTDSTKHYTVETSYAPGVWEPARNVSLLKNNKVSVIEPRIVAVPGTIKAGGVWTGIPEDKQDPDVFYMAYGTSTNLRDVDKLPEDLFLTFSTDRGTTLILDEWVVNPDSDGNFPGETVEGWYRLAKGDAEQGEVQLRMTPDGSRLYATWLDEGEEGSDIIFRRLMPVEFPANDAP